ncbi:hypothetical protein FACS1894145_5780 [Bacteroidia bacterium]|nr:hypothetical protein FACS1894145_5780 [Bacteroidia bacterium]
MFISEENKVRILAASQGKLVEVISDFSNLRKSGISYTCECQVCQSEQTLTITPGKNIFKCFRCNNLSGKTPVDYLMKGQGKSFPEALEYLARKFNIFIDESKPAPVKKKSKKTGKMGVGKDSFCSRILEASGLTYDDVVASVFKTEDNKTAFKSKTFRPGSIDEKGNITDGDDVIIEYYDLEGNPVKFEIKDTKGKGTGKYREYFRVRWQFPEEHKDKNGRPGKYKSPYGAYTYIYIPQLIRTAYTCRQKIPVLFIQEGEKKAEKACKHGIPSIAISGIQNLGTNGRLPEDIIKIIQTCEVTSVVFLLDADWNDLAPNLRITDNVTYRPYLFFSAIRNYKDYMRTLVNRDLYVEIYFGYVLENPAKDKGIDDLLANTLKGKEGILRTDFDILVNEKNLTGQYLKLHKITTATDQKIKEIWNLENPKSFAEMHRHILKDMPEFTIGKHRWKFEAEEIVSAEPIQPDEQFWEELRRVDRSGNERITYEFKYVRSQNFFQNRGFGRFRRLDNTFDYVHLTPPVVKTVFHWEIQDFLYEFARMNCNEEVNEMLIRGGTQYLGPEKLMRLGFIEPNFQQSARDRQLFYFAVNCWEISAEKVIEIEYSNVTHHIWSEQRKSFPAKLTKQLMTVSKPNSGFSIQITNTGRQCHFLQFLVNTSNFTWRKQELQKVQPDLVITDDDIQENTEHLMAKLCAIGYMLMENKDRSNSKAVVAMDGKQSEVGASNGRSGKSIIGELFKNIMATVYINGKKSDLSTDNFL